MDYLAMTLLMFVGMILMIVILLQRGRGGGLAGAFGGLGGQSAFGTKAGDVFTKITVVLATIWVVLAGVSGFALRAGAEKAASAYPGGADAPLEQTEIRSLDDTDADTTDPIIPPASTPGSLLPTDSALPTDSEQEAPATDAATDAAPETPAVTPPTPAPSDAAPATSDAKPEATDAKPEAADAAPATSDAKPPASEPTAKESE